MGGLLLSVDKIYRAIISSRNIVYLLQNGRKAMTRHFGWDAFALGFGPRGFFWRGPRRGRRQWFASGDMKYVILKLLKDKPRHGYEVMKRSEEHTSELQSRLHLV